MRKEGFILLREFSQQLYFLKLGSDISIRDVKSSFMLNACADLFRYYLANAI